MVMTGSEGNGVQLHLHDLFFPQVVIKKTFSFHTQDLGWKT
jgi:hypothetical protein